MMHRMLPVALVLLTPLAVRAQDAGDAKARAQEILTKGAALFDMKDASAVAATYAEDGELILIGRNPKTGKFQTQSSRGRTAIEHAYKGLFANRPSGAKSKNVVEFAHQVGPDLMIIHGTFALGADAPSRPLPFVQVRTRQGDRWLILSVQVFVGVQE